MQQYEAISAAAHLRLGSSRGVAFGSSSGKEARDHEIAPVMLRCHYNRLDQWRFPPPIGNCTNRHPCEQSLSSSGERS